MNTNATITFADSYNAGLPAGGYSMTVTHTVSASSDPPLTAAQDFVVAAPQFTIDPATVRSTHPQSGASTGSDYCILPHIVLDDHTLPWERAITGAPASTPAGTPWIALVLFADGDLIANNGGTLVSPIQVSDLLAIGQSGPTVGPAIDPSSVAPQSVLSTQCQTIQMPGKTFNAVMPTLADVTLLAHCQTMAGSSTEPAGTVSALLANRLPLDPSHVQSTRFSAHLVSLDGFGANLAPDDSTKPSTPIPSTATVQMVTLYSWSFVAVPENVANFEALAAGIAANAGPLALAPGDSANEEVTNRFHDGYAPLTYVTTSGEQTFGWYRGPFAAVQPPALPKVGNPATTVCAATSADELMIYVEEWGVFDLSYSAAWNFGRARALADANFAQNLMNAQRQVSRAAAKLAQTMSMPHLAGIDDPYELTAPDVARRRFAAMIGDGLGYEWLRATKSSSRNVAHGRRGRARRGVHPRDLLARADVRDAIAKQISDALEPIDVWLQSLVNLVPVPFSHLVPNPAMLPVESIRFFFVDPNWIDALIAGATSIPLQSSFSLAATQLIRERFLAKAKYPAAGLLLRSQLVSAWPTLVIQASSKDTTLQAVRDNTLSTSVRMLLFDAIPDTVSIGEPYHGLQLGMDYDAGQGSLSISTRNLSGSNIGMPTGQSVPVTPGAAGVLDVTTIAGQLGASLGSGDFGMQMIRTPYSLIFGNS